MKNMHRIFVLMLLVLLGACANENVGAVCIKPSGVEPAAGSPSTGSETLKKVSDGIKEAKIITTIVEDLRGKLFGTPGASGVAPTKGAAQEMFEAISGSGQFKSAIAAAFTLFVTFYGLGVVGGYVQVSLVDAVIRVAKIGFISVMAFSYGEFLGFIGSFFIDSRDELMGYLLQSTSSLGGGAGTDAYSAVPSNACTGTAGAPLTGAPLIFCKIFTPFDNFIAQIFSPHMFAILGALLDLYGQNAGPYATGYGLLLAVGLFSFFRAMMEVVIIYIFSLFANAILFAVAPIYLSFLLFDKTRDMFDSWLKQLVNYNLQPVLAAMLLSLFIDMLGPFLNEILGLSVVNVTQGCNGDKQSCWKFADSNCLPYAIGVTGEQPMSLQTILLFVFFSWCFKAYIGITSAIAVALSNGGVNLSDVSKQLVGKVTQAFHGAGHRGG